MTRGFHGISGTLVTLGLLTAPGALEAQIGDARPVDEVSATLDLAMPFIEDRDFGSRNVVLKGRLAFPMGGATGFVDLGLARASIEGAGSSTAFAGPRLGVLMPLGEGGFSLEASATTPFASDDADSGLGRQVGSLAEMATFERWFADVVGASLAVVGDRPVGDGGHTVGGRLGAKLLVPTEGGENASMVHWALRGTTELQAVTMGAELSGYRFLGPDAASGEGNDLLTVSGTLTAVQTRPTLYVRLPVDDDLSEVLSAVLGVSFTFGG